MNIFILRAVKLFHYDTTLNCFPLFFFSIATNKQIANEEMFAIFAATVFVNEDQNIIL